VTSGSAYDVPSAGTANYAAAKGGIISLTRAVAVEGKEFGNTCNAGSPLARTGMSEPFLARDAGPASDPLPVAPIVVFLASDAAASITGAVFRVARGEISVVGTAVGAAARSRQGRWTAEEIAERIGEIASS